MITNLLQAPRTAVGEVSDLLQRTSERHSDYACLACVSGGEDLSPQWHKAAASVGRARHHGDLSGAIRRRLCWLLSSVCFC